MDKIIIRDIEEKDIESVVDIQIGGWRTAYKGIVDDNFLNSMDKNERIERRKNDYKENGFIVAEIDGKVVGFCRYIDNNNRSPEIRNADCELAAIYVNPELKYKGIGTKLVNYVKEEFRKKGKTKMIIWCLKDNEPSKKFYTKMGGKIINEKKIEIGEKEYDEVCFEYTL